MKRLKRFKPPQGHTKRLYEEVGRLREAIQLLGVEWCSCGAKRRSELIQVAEDCYCCVGCIESALQHVRRPKVLVPWLLHHRTQFEKRRGYSLLEGRFTQGVLDELRRHIQAT